MNKKFLQRCHNSVILFAFALSQGLVAITGPALSVAQENQGDVLSLGLEELMNLEVYSVSKKAQKLKNAAAAVFVLSSEDIRRSGAQSIPELLRLVPGLSVAQFNANTWSVSSRGFSGRFSNKLLVLIDGRTVYTPTFSGVYWDEKDTLLEDIERIEVIRGPGGTVWGANAVNGVINIITKSAEKTQGGYLTAGAGNELENFSGARYGQKISEDGWFRVYAKQLSRDDSRQIESGKPFDHNQAAQAGFRADWNLNEIDRITVHGDMVHGDQANEISLPSSIEPFNVSRREETEFNGANVLTNWEHLFSADSIVSTQFYYDRTERREVLADVTVDTFDIELQHQYRLSSQVDWTWGGAMRLISDDIVSSDTVKFSTDSELVKVMSGFAQVEYSIVPDSLAIILGSKLEHNDYTGVEVEPNLRISYTPTSNQTWWAAYSRAVRTPSRVNESLSADIGAIPLPAGNGISVLRLNGNSELDSEMLNAYEIGFRSVLDKGTQVDLAGFIFDYDNLQSLELGRSYLDTTISYPQIVTPVHFENLLSGIAYGGEAMISHELYDWWQLRASYAYLMLNLEADSASSDKFSISKEGDSAEHQVGLVSRMDLGDRVEFDAFLRYLDRLPTSNTDAYLELDLRLGFKLARKLQLAVVGQNLLKNSHREISEKFLAPVSTELQRGVYVQLSWGFD